MQGRITETLNEKGQNVNIDKTIAPGYVHDIGKYNGESRGHVMREYNYLKERGYDEEYCNVCLTHSYLNNDIICTVGGIPDPNKNLFLTDFIKNHKYIIKEKLINLCDLMCPHGDKVYTIDKRLVDIMIRRGAYSNTQYHIKETYKLKEYLDDLEQMTNLRIKIQNSNLKYIDSNFIVLNQDELQKKTGEYLKKSINNNLFMFVYFIDDKLVANCRFYVDKHFPTYNNPSGITGYICNVFTLEEYRNNCYQKKTFNVCLNMLRKWE